MEESTPVKNQADDQIGDSQLLEEVNQTRAGEEEYGDIVLQPAQDKELNYSMNTEAETGFNSPEHMLCFNLKTYDTEDSLGASSNDDGEGGVGTHCSVAIDSSGVALMVKAESNDEQEMRAELQNVSPGTCPGSGPGTHELNCVPHDETRGLIPEVNNGRVAAIAVATENTEQRALIGRTSEGRWVTSQSPPASERFKYIASLGEVDHSQREDEDTTREERDETAAGPDVVVGGSVDPEILVDSGALWGMEEQISGTVEQEGEARRTGGALSDDECSRHEAHKTDGEDFETEEPLFEFTLDPERSESTGAASDEAAALGDSIRYDNVAAQDGFMFCEDILILPDAGIQTTTEACEGEATSTTMTEENRQILSLLEDYVEPESVYQPIENQIKSFEDGQMETEEIVVNISDVAMGKDGSQSEEATAESVQQRNTVQSNRSREETPGLGSFTDMSSDILMEIRDLSDELLESTASVPELQTETSTQKSMEHVEDVLAVEDENAMAFGLVTKEILALCAETTDYTPSDTTEMENQVVSLADTRTPPSSSSGIVDDDDEAADKTSKKHDQQIQVPDEREETSGQIEGENEGWPQVSYSGKSGLVGIADLLEAPECYDSDYTSGGYGKPECEVLTTTTEGIILSEMVTTTPLGVLDVSPHSFTEEKPTHSNSPEQKPQHHPLWSRGKLSDNEEVSSKAEQDESSYELQMNEEMTIKDESFEIDPESSDVVAIDERDETSVIAVPITNNVDEDCSMKPGVENPSCLLPSDMAFPAEVPVMLRDRQKFGERRQGPGLDSKHPSYKVSLVNKAWSRRSEFIDSPVAGLSAEERARQRHSLPPGSNQFELDVNVLDLTIQKSRILVKNPSVRPPTDTRALLQMPSLEPSPSHPSSTQLAKPLAGRPIGGLGVGIKLPGFGVGFPALKKTLMVVKDGDESVPEQKSEPQQGMTSMSPKPTVTDCKPRWTPPKHPGFGNPLMSELKSKLKKTSKE